MFPIFIPSRGRPKCKTLSHLPQAWVVIEPHELPLYRLYHSQQQIFVLPESNRGIGYVRQQILDAARRLGLTWFWMIDDDVTAFYEAINQKSIKTTGEHALTSAEEIITVIPNVGQACLEPSQYAWAAKEIYANEGHCEACVLINVKKTKNINYRPHLKLKEDIDFSLQILSHGCDNIRVKRFSFSSPKVGTNSGGLNGLYNDQIQLEESQKIVDIWGDKYCRVGKKPTGRTDVIIKWKAFAQAAKAKINQGSEYGKDG